MSHRITVAEIGDLPEGILPRIVPRVAELLRLEPGRQIRLDPALAYDVHRNQYNARKLLDALKELTDSEDLAVGAASVDLYHPMLTFVFGEAELPGRAAVFSIYRLRQEFYGLPADPELLVERAAKEMLHEIGHALGLRHCHDSACAMSSSHSVESVDLKNLRLCSTCSRLLRTPAEGRPSLPLPG